MFLGYCDVICDIAWSIAAPDCQNLIFLLIVKFVCIENKIKKKKERKKKIIESLVRHHWLNF